MTKGGEVAGSINRAAGLITYEVRCAVCGHAKWPTLPERPLAYVCVLCRSKSPAQRLRRAQAGRKGVGVRAAQRVRPG